MDRRYFEIEFAHELFDTSKDDADTYSICIIAEHHPSIEEAKEFCKEDMKRLGYDCVISVTEISHDEAHQFFDMENEANFPILK